MKVGENGVIKPKLREDLVSYMNVASAITYSSINFNEPIPNGNGRSYVKQGKVVISADLSPPNQFRFSLGFIPKGSVNLSLFFV